MFQERKHFKQTLNCLKDISKKKQNYDVFLNKHAFKRG